jgi:hypothetical protein
VAFNSFWEERTLSQSAVKVPDLNQMQEVVTLLANLRDTAHQLPEGSERQNALREISGYQIRMAASRLGSAGSLELEQP